MSLIKVLSIQFVFAVILFFAADYAYTNYIRVEENQESIYRVPHDIYHHSLLPSFDGIGLQGARG